VTRTPSPTPRRSGFTLLEVLVALVIFGIILGVTYAAITQSLQVQSSQEAATSSQARLRRVTEVFTQELRSAVLGAISNTPFTAGESSVSFTLLDGGAGYQVLPHDSGNNHSFTTANTARIVAPVSSKNDLDLEGNQALMVNASGQAVIFTVNTVTRHGGPGSVEWNLAHPGCANTIDYTPNTLVFKVKTLGLEYDAASRTLFQREGGGARLPVAFDLAALRIQYVYRDQGGTPYTFAAPLRDGAGHPLRKAEHQGREIELARLQLTLESEARALTGPVRRSYLSQVELSANPSFQIQAVTTCN
jgi:prepilin-type N-terminal cleavage/methylation domain-containing protein